MKRVAWLALGLMASVTAQAASFDCAKASTKVEHLICDNPEISKLDDELATSYKAALHDQSKAGQVRHAQRQWLNERNICADVACLREKYKERLTFFQVVEASAARTSSDKKLYPPYPDVWGYELPYPTENDRDATYSGYVNPDGGVSFLIITDIKRIKGSYEAKFASLDFFSGVITKFKSDDEENEYGAKNRKNRISFNGGKALSFSDGLQLKFDGYSHNCYRSFPFRLQVIAKNGDILASKYLIYMRDTPQIRDVTSYCEMADGKDSFNESVESMYGSIVMLQDDTFIFSEGGGNMILRMDKNLETKFKSKHLFIVDADVIDGIQKVLSEKNDLNFQSLNDAVSDYLKTHGKGE